MIIRSPLPPQIPVIGFTTTAVGPFPLSSGRRSGAYQAGAYSGRAIDDQCDYPNVMDCFAAVFVVASVAFGPVMTWLLLG
jgi:hypothetical protein